MSLILKFFGGIWAKIALAGAALALIAGYLWNMKRKAREEGRREVIDDMNEEGRKAEDAMRDADKPKDVNDVEDDLRSGRF